MQKETKETRAKMLLQSLSWGKMMQFKKMADTGQLLQHFPREVAWDLLPFPRNGSK